MSRKDRFPWKAAALEDVRNGRKWPRLEWTSRQCIQSMTLFERQVLQLLCDGRDASDLVTADACRLVLNWLGYHVMIQASGTVFVDRRWFDPNSRVHAINKRFASGWCLAGDL